MDNRSVYTCTKCGTGYDSPVLVACTAFDIFDGYGRPCVLTRTP